VKTTLSASALEVARGDSVAAVVRTAGCMKDTAGACQVNADVMFDKPDGSVFQEATGLDLPAACRPMDGACIAGLGAAVGAACGFLISLF
jgi:hypothetical protein